MGGLLVVNPRASGVSEALVAAVEAALPQPLTTVQTGSRGEATELARDAEATVDAIYVFGGDGTYNEVLNGVTGATPLGFVPGGGTSVLPRALGLPREPVAAARRLAVGSERRISLGRVDGRRFGFNAGIGLDAELVRRVDALGRDREGRRPGDAAFARTVVGMIAAHRGRFPEELEVEGLGRAAFAFVANCDPYTYVGRLGLRVARGASFDGGLDVVAPARVRARDLPLLTWRLARGTGPGRGVLAGHDLTRFAVRCDRPLPLQVDGEDLGDVTGAVFEAERAAVVALV